MDKMAKFTGNHKGKHNGGFIDGRCSKKYYCSCGNEISMRSALYLRGLCRKCCFNQESRQKMSKSMKGRISWNKGLKGVQEPYWLGKSNKDVISKHHIDGNKKNNDESNFLKIKQGLHRSLHWNGYKYLVKIGLIDIYLSEFITKYRLNTDKLNCKVMHHRDCNRENNNPKNLMYLKDKKIHNKLHQEAYLYLVRINKVNDYISWFLLKEEEKFQKTETIEELK